MAPRRETARSTSYEIDLNLLPGSRRRARPVTKLLTLFALLFAIVSIVRLSGLYFETEAQVVENEARLSGIRSELTQMRREMGDLNQLSMNLEAKKSKVASLKDSLEFIGKNKRDWSGVLETVQEKTGREVALESLIGTQGVVRLRGKTQTLAGALALVTALEDSQRFTRVILLNYTSKPAGTSKSTTDSTSSGGNSSETTVDFEILADVKKL